MQLSYELKTQFENYCKTELKGNEAVYDIYNDDQFSVIKKYFRWFTKNRLRELVQNTSLETLPEKAKQMSELMGFANDWEYDGCVDTGYFGGGTCTLGHTLRYQHFAVSPSTGLQVVFGIKCVSDFFGIEQSKLKAISKIQNQAMEEIKIITFIRETERSNQYINTYYKDLLDVVHALPDVNAAFGADWNYIMGQFLRVGLLLTPSMIDRYLFVKNGIYKKTMAINSAANKVMAGIDNDSRLKDVVNSLLDGHQNTWYAIKSLEIARGNIAGSQEVSADHKKVLLILSQRLEEAYDILIKNGMNYSFFDMITKESSIDDESFKIAKILGYGLKGDRKGLDDAECFKVTDIIPSDMLSASRYLQLAIEKLHDQSFINYLKSIAKECKQNQITIYNKIEETADYYKDGSSDYLVKIVLDIASRYEMYGENIRLSDKQVNIIERVYMQLQDKKREDEAKKSSTDNDSSIHGNSDDNYNRYLSNKHKIDYIISNRENTAVSKNKLLFDIIGTVTSRSSMSDKQFNHIESGYNYLIECIREEKIKQDKEREEKKIQMLSEEISNTKGGGTAAIDIPSIVQMSDLLGTGRIVREI